MIDEILPPEVRAVEAFGDVPDSPLFAAEEAMIAGAVDKRRAEFTTVRACARRALGELGMPPVPIVRAGGGAPQWPAGVVGSMTHCDGYRAAAVAWAEDITTIGIDAEPHARLPDGVLEVAGTAAERARLPELADRWPAVHWDRLLFCAKEAVYKAWFPLTGRWLGFEDARIHFDLDGVGAFTAELLVPGPVVEGRALAGFTGRWLARGDVLVAVTVLRRPGREAGLTPGTPRR
ncbi:MAG TPA: 4'-phosphopantetheinyl transferase superfamily protein [Mycobacteriales bacterium]|nr:4'-phosphopantetheinyl transferase superfamily protein [Mycobacteriales bacterium]